MAVLDHVGSDVFEIPHDPVVQRPRRAHRPREPERPEPEMVRTLRCPRAGAGASLLLAGSLVAIGCDGGPYHSDQVACPTIAIPSIVVEVVDADGGPAAIGATATISKKGKVWTGFGFGDPLFIRVHAGNAGGVFDVLVEKPWHAESRIEDVNVPAGECGVLAPVNVRMELNLLPDAPAVRQVVLPPFAYGFGRVVCGTRHGLIGYVLTDEQTSREMLWESRDPNVVSVEPGETSTVEGSSAWLIPQCAADSGSSTYVLGMSQADPSVKDSVQVSITL